MLLTGWDMSPDTGISPKDLSTWYLKDMAVILCFIFCFWNRSCLSKSYITILITVPFTFGTTFANRWSSSLTESVPFTLNLPNGDRSITPTFSITCLYSRPTGSNQFVRRKLGLKQRIYTHKTKFGNFVLFSAKHSLLFLQFNNNSKEIDFPNCR